MTERIYNPMKKPLLSIAVMLIGFALLWWVAALYPSHASGPVDPSQNVNHRYMNEEKPIPFDGFMRTNRSDRRIWKTEITN